MYSGLASIAANATNTMALWPASLASAWAYRKHLQANIRLAITLAIPSFLGSIAGAILLLTTPESVFRLIVPFLILLACGLLMMQEKIGGWLATRSQMHPRRHAFLLWISQFAIGIYGGYFGAGIGIMMLAAMAIFLPHDLQTANALKILLATIINITASVAFVINGAVVYKVGAIMCLAAIVGGLVGAQTAQEIIPALDAAECVVAYGVFVAAYMMF